MRHCLHLAIWLALAGGAAAATAPGFPSAEAVTGTADLIDRPVETRDGAALGRVHDLAVDLESGRLVYVVVSVGSFLIDDSLIAVAPGALRTSADADGTLVLEVDGGDLLSARRFSDADWPLRADVVGAPADDRAVAEADGEPPAEGERGTATISDGSKTATLSAGQRGIRYELPPAEDEPGEPPTGDDTAAAGDQPPATRFDRLDRDGDGVLNRAEIAHELTRRDSYAGIDQDASGAIDRGEFDALLRSREGG